MSLIYKDKAHVDRGTATLRNAVDHARKDTYIKKELASAHDSNYLYNQQTLNATSIQSKLIEYVGRYTDRFGSDLLFAICDLEAFLGKDDTEDAPHGRWVIGIGIHEDGCDFNYSIMLNARADYDHWSYFINLSKYRKILAINVEDELVKDSDGECYRNRDIRLYDITHELYRIDEEDVD